MKQTTKPLPPQDEILKSIIVELVLQMTDGYTDLRKYSFDGDDYDNLYTLNNYIKQRELQTLQDQREQLLNRVEKEVIEEDEKWEIVFKPTKATDGELTIDLSQFANELRAEQRKKLDILRKQ